MNELVGGRNVKVTQLNEKNGKKANLNFKSCEIQFFKKANTEFQLKVAKFNFFFLKVGGGKLANLNFISQKLRKKVDNF